jgi:serine/threonine protein kinase
MLKLDTVLQNRYQIAHTIGKGGMGAVYLAQDTRLGNTVAIKETFFKEDAMRRAFEREARLLAGLRHPALPRVMDHFTEGEGQFLVMEYIAGDDLETLLAKREGPFPTADVMDWSLQLLDALDYLHKRTPPVIHRDIKPQNLKLAGRQIVLLDFGLAKGRANGMTQTNGKSLYGYTATYAPLEQIRDDGTDARSDLYSLGATLYHLLTGTVPADALMRANSILGHRPDPLRPLHEANPEVSPAVACALHLALALHSGQRPPSAAALRQILTNARHNPHLGAAPPPTLFLDPNKKPKVSVPAGGKTVVDKPPARPRPVSAVVNKTDKNVRATVVANSSARLHRPSQIAASPFAPTEAESLIMASPKSRRLFFAVSGLAAALVLAALVWAFSGGLPRVMPAASAETPSVPQQFLPDNLRPPDDIVAPGGGGPAASDTPLVIPTPATLPPLSADAGGGPGASPTNPTLLGDFANMTKAGVQATPQPGPSATPQPAPQPTVNPAPATQPPATTQSTPQVAPAPNTQPQPVPPPPPPLSPAGPLPGHRLPPPGPGGARPPGPPPGGVRRP